MKKNAVVVDGSVAVAGVRPGVYVIEPVFLFARKDNHTALRLPVVRNRLAQWDGFWR